MESYEDMANLVLGRIHDYHAARQARNRAIRRVATPAACI